MNNQFLGFAFILIVLLIVALIIVVKQINIIHNSINLLNKKCKDIERLTDNYIRNLSDTMSNTYAIDKKYDIEIEKLKLHKTSNDAFNVVVSEINNIKQNKATAEKVIERFNLLEKYLRIKIEDGERKYVSIK